MVFVEFAVIDRIHPGRRKHFVGVSLQAILDDTKGGKEFGFEKFSAYRVVTETQIRSLNLRFTEEGILAVQQGCLSYMLGLPN